MDCARYNLWETCYRLWKNGIEDYATRLTGKSMRVVVYISRSDVDKFFVLSRTSANCFYYFDSDGVLKTFHTVAKTVEETIKFFKE